LISENPFAQEQLDDIFQTMVGHPDALKRRESTTLEIKENFQPNSFTDYGRTLAAFANRLGGYMLFGVKNKPHLLTGMTNTRFRDFDPNTLTQFLNSSFSPAICWDHCLHSVKQTGRLFQKRQSITRWRHILPLPRRNTSYYFWRPPYFD
jgi:hypothetical protein